MSHRTRLDRFLDLGIPVAGAIAVAVWTLLLLRDFGLLRDQ